MLLAVMVIVQYYKFCDRQEYDFELAFECTVITQLSREGNLGCAYIFFCNFLPDLQFFSIVNKFTALNQIYSTIPASNPTTSCPFEFQILLAKVLFLRLGFLFGQNEIHAMPNINSQKRLSTICNFHH